ncbi:ABC transporter ATP-binding protein [Lactococcus lactis]|uniref:Methionine ABC transporter ATP-binding protein n=1 Tax=Lactococcus lactis subsp. lactis TaxID=1360 RepID=A0A0V8D3D7_LACLL|nr:ABC transporter ATP-binding protein [Lactococcus lactis]KSU08068.1 Methionine ABC transporter ATP-binding protein [Lactococcus lactis subsp. lactis]MBN2937500.1 ABC transporter ATP-binding protein [Lactococcus lactis]MCQ4971816.1 ABC transporter ATP-binding protein [Lactococcus lactis]MCQ4997616.1 ABC transporter ATP-binding protein [Lactococcus lactis]
MFELTNITKEFLHRKIFDKFNLTFEAGKVYAIIGQSGSGKTTLLNMIAKLESYEGSIRYEGKELSKIKKHSYFLNDLSYLFQNFGLIENETIDKNLDLGLINQKLSKKTKQEKKLETLAQVNVAYLKLNQKIYELSGGEAQRVALAKAILKNSPVILADEPTAALDSENSEEVMKLLLSMKNEKRIIIIATHNPAIWKMADEVVELSR